MEKSEQIKDLAIALALAQGEMTSAIKDSDNPFFRSKYADLASVWDACREPLSKNGLSVVQTTELLRQPDDGPATVLETILLHSSGQWISSHYHIKPVKEEPQSMGSAFTYARRYALMAMVGIAPEEDDGEQATGKVPSKREAQQDKSQDKSQYQPPKPTSIRPANEKRAQATTAKEKPAPSPEAVGEATRPERDLATLEFKDAGEFKTACLKYFDLQGSQVDKEVSMYDLSNPNQRAEAWRTILAVYKIKEGSL